MSEPPKYLNGPSPSGEPIAVGDDVVVHQWADRLGVTVEMLRAGIDAVGPMPAALATYFTSRGARRKVITEAMRAAGRPKRNSQSWRRDKTGGPHSS